MLRAALPAGREARRVLVGSLFSALGVGLTLPFLLVYLTEVRGLPAGSVGLLVSWTGVVGLALSPLAGTLIDRLGARPVAISLTLVLVAGTAALAYVDSVATAAVALTVNGVGFAGLFAANDTILTTLTAEAERQRTFGFAFALLNLGIGVGGLTSGVVVDVHRPITFQGLYLANAVVQLVPVAILLSMPHVGRRLATAGAVNGSAEPPAVSEPEAPAPARVAGGYRFVVRDKPFLAFFLFSLLLATVGYAQIEVGFAAFATVVAHVPARAIAFAFAANAAVIVVSQLFVLRWLEGRSRSRALAISGVLFALAWLILALGGLAGRDGQVGLATVAVVAFGAIFAAGETTMSPILPVITNALAPDELRGRYNAVGSMVLGIGSIIGPAMAGPLIGGGLGALWVVLVIGGSLLASGMALRLRRMFTPVQDGVAVAATSPAVAALAS